jgi:hypothetical protein
MIRPAHCVLFVVLWMVLILCFSFSGCSPPITTTASDAALTRDAQAAAAIIEKIDR